MAQPNIQADKPTPKTNTVAGFLVFHSKPVPDFDKEVGDPLRSAQAAVEAARKAEEARLAAEAAKIVYVAPVAAVYAMPADWYKAFIYGKESGNDPTAHNPDGCRGLGQACPGSKLPCSDTDYACQDAWFTGYMLDRYHSWYNAYIYWIGHNSW